MAHILTEQNVKAYATWKGQPWGIAELLYDQLPMLAIRNYLTEDEDDRSWPLCWAKGRCIRHGIRECIELLRDWRAFRPLGPRAAQALQCELGRQVPDVVLDFQNNAKRLGATNVTDAVREEKTTGRLVDLMCDAVERISALKKLKRPTPMLGSKVMHFFFPEFFPVWDTAYVKKALGGLAQKGEIQIAATGEYRHYMTLFVEELREASGLADLNEKLIRYAIGESGDEFLRELLDQSVGDLSAITFELALIGYAHRENVRFYSR